MRDRIILFQPAKPAVESNTFAIEYGSQMTITAMGLQQGESISFQMVHVPSINPDRCACPPIPVELPSVAAYVELKCCGETIKLTQDNPVVILDNPQRTLLRAVLDAYSTDEVWAWAAETKTANVTDRLRGCQCEGNR